VRQVPADGVRSFSLIDFFPMCFYVHREPTRFAGNDFRPLSALYSSRRC
jgi:hypothetical protein